MLGEAIGTFERRDDVCVLELWINDWHATLGRYSEALIAPQSVSVDSLESEPWNF